MNTSPTSKDYGVLKNNIVSLVQDLKSCDDRMTEVTADIRALGLSIPVVENESEMSYLSRVATLCNERQFRLLEQEERQSIKDEMLVPARSTNRISRFFDRLSRLTA